MENPVAPAQPAAAPAPASAGNKFIGGAQKVAGAIDTVGGVADKINNFAASGRGNQVLAGVNTQLLQVALLNVINKKELTRQDIQIITQAEKSLKKTL